MKLLKIAAIIFAVAPFLTANAFAGDETRPDLSDDAAELVQPVLSEYLIAHSESFDERGHYISKSQHEDIFEERFIKLLDNKTEAADEAIAALLCFYIGEWPAEALVCEAINSGGRIVPYLKRFLDSPPITGLEPIPSFFTDIPNLRKEVLERIENNEECRYED